MMISTVTNLPDTGLSTYVKVFRTVPELEQIRSSWESWPGNRDSDPNIYFTILRSRPEVLRPHVMVVYRDGRPDAILVGRLERVRLNFKVGYLNCKPTANVLYFVYGGPRGNDSFANCHLLVDDICRSLSMGEADTAYLNFVRMDSALYQLARKIPRVLNRDHTCVTQAHFSATLPRSPEEFYSNLSANARWQAKSKGKKLEKAFPGAVNIRCFREVAETEKLVHDAEFVVKKSYQRGLGVGFADSPEMRDHMRMKAEKGWLRGYVLYLSDQPSAFWIGDLNQKSFRSDYLAFDDKFSKYSPGIYLILKVIEGFCGDDGDSITEVDFATGYAQYKEVLSNQKWSEASVYIFASSFNGIKLQIIRSFTGCFEKLAKNLLARTGLLQKIKKNWRTHAKRKQTAETQS
jgi:Acetyltransferase (GNAT) domain